MTTDTALPYSFLKIIKIIGLSGNTDSLSKFQSLSFMKTTTNSAFPIFAESRRSFCTGTYRSYFWTRCAAAKAVKLQICSRSQIDLRNQGAICENVSCTRESMTEPIDGAPPKPSPAKRRSFQTLKKHTMRSGLWSP